MPSLAISSMPLSGCISRLFFYFLLLLLSLRRHHHLPVSSAHVDMSTVAFDADPLDLDAEEPPEFQGDPRSPKGISGSVTSPQANVHRLPFFKKVTPGPRTAPSPATLLVPLLL